MSDMDLQPIREETIARPLQAGHKRPHSSNSDTSSSSSDSSSSSSEDAKRKRRYRKKKSKKRNSKLKQLSKEISELRNLFSQVPSYNEVNTDRVSICSGVSGDLYENIDCSNQYVTDVHSMPDSKFTFDIETKLKEPSVPKTPEQFVKMLADAQHFGTAAWTEVRYAETQKLYNHTPGFVDLESNDEIRRYDSLTHLAKADKAYAAITFCVLKQKESLQESIRELLTWAKTEPNNNCNLLNKKIEDLFLNGEFHKISNDLLQLVCGHRSEIIEVRRDAIIKNVKDPVVKMSLKKIPPSITHIFESVAFSSTLEKAGGVRKTFWPLRSEALHKSVNTKTRQPSGGSGVRKFMAPSNGAQMSHYLSGPSTSRHAYNNMPPSKGGYHYMNQDNFHGMAHDMTCHGNYIPSDNVRGSFQNRGSRSRNAQRGGRGRVHSSHAFRGNSKRYDQ
jgi:hypothetical protein